VIFGKNGEQRHQTQQRLRRPSKPFDGKHDRTIKVAVSRLLSA